MGIAGTSAGFGQQETGALLMFKMTVEDVFAIRNRGVVATGQVESRHAARRRHRASSTAGRVSRSTPSRSSASSIDEATTGENVGVLIKEIERDQLNRGDVLTSSSSSYGEAPPI